MRRGSGYPSGGAAATVLALNLPRLLLPAAMVWRMRRDRPFTEPDQVAAAALRALGRRPRTVPGALMQASSA